MPRSDPGRPGKKLRHFRPHTPSPLPGSAARRRIRAGGSGIGNLPAFGSSRLRSGSWHRRGSQQQPGIRVNRVPEQLFRRRDFDDPPCIHHGDPVADVPNHPEIVRDENVRQPHVAFQVVEQVDDLRLHRNIERRNRLVRHHETRIHHQRAGDADPLPLTAGKRMRITGLVFGFEPDLQQHFIDAALKLRPLRHPVNHQRFGDDSADRHARVQARKRVLENHLRGSPERNQLPGRQLSEIDVATVARRIEICVAGREVERPQNRPHRRRFSASRLPDSPSVSFRRRSNETRFTAFTSPVFFGITPRLRIGKNLHKSRTASSGGASESALKSFVL